MVILSAVFLFFPFHDRVSIDTSGRWRRKSEPPVERPQIDKEIRVLIRRMSRENSLWEAPRVRSELRILGFEVAERTVAKRRIKYCFVILLHARHGQTLAGTKDFFDRNENFPRNFIPTCSHMY
jgi:hypothetical protein